MLLALFLLALLFLLVRVGALKMTVQTGACRHRLSVGTGQLGVHILRLGEIESFYLSVAAPKLVWADPSLICTSMLLGPKSKQASKQQTGLQRCDDASCTQAPCLHLTAFTQTPPPPPPASLIHPSTHPSKARVAWYTGFAPIYPSIPPSEYFKTWQG